MEFLARIGSPICEGLAYFRDLCGVTGRAFVPFLQVLGRGGRVVRRTTLMQIYFTGVQGVPVIALLAALLGVALGAVIPQRELLVTFLVKGFIPELSALLAALAILSRSTTAITVELGNMTVNGEMDLLRRLGIDPDFHVIVPRAVGVLFASVGLTAIAAAIAPIAAASILSLNSQISPVALLTDVADDLTLYSGLSALYKAILFGGILVICALREGLFLSPFSTEVPKSVSKAVIRALLLLFTLEAGLLVLAFAS